jgi:hypothetical protein
MRFSDREREREREREFDLERNSKRDKITRPNMQQHEGLF